MSSGRGSTTIVEVLRRYPGGEAAADVLLNWAWRIARAFHEPLTMAAGGMLRSARARRVSGARRTGRPCAELVARGDEARLSVSETTFFAVVT
jgi:hypothetical protein